MGQLANLTLTWMSSGVATLSFATKGGIYQNMSYFSAVTINALPELPPAPSALVVTPIYPLALQVQWNNSLTSSITGYIVQISFMANFTSTIYSAVIPFGPNTAGGIFRTPSLASPGCVFVRIVAYNEAGQSLTAPQTGGCVVLIDELPAIQHLALTTLGDEWLTVDWTAALPPDLFSFTGTFDYLVETISSNGSLLANTSMPATQTEVLLPVQLGTPIQVEVRVTDQMLGSGPASAVCVQLSNSKSVYLVPLQFVVSPLSVQATAGSSSLLILKPISPPAVDAWVRIDVLDNFIASVTDHVQFTAGSMAQQNVIVSHLRKGSTNTTFTAIGGLYSGLQVTVVITTLPSIQ